MTDNGHDQMRSAQHTAVEDALVKLRAELEQCQRELAQAKSEAKSLRETLVQVSNAWRVLFRSLG